MRLLYGMQNSMFMSIAAMGDFARGYKSTYLKRKGGNWDENANRLNQEKKWRRGC